jgi:hypothetical protein
MIAICAPSAREASTSVRVISKTAPERTSPAEITRTKRHHHDGGMAEAGEGGLGGHEAQHNGQQERAEGDHVVAEPSPQQEREDAPEEREEKDLVLRHRRDPNPPAGFAKAVSDCGPGDRRGAKNPCFRAGKRGFSAPSHRSRTAQPVAAPGGLM